jgi:hypothetical protein
MDKQGVKIVSCADVVIEAKKKVSIKGKMTDISK